MATFVQLTDHAGKPILVNLDRVISVWQLESTCQLMYSDQHAITVKESLQMIKALAWDALDTDETEKRARLVDAAHDLLAAASALVEAINYQWNGWADGYQRVVDAKSNLQHAIAKAKEVVT